MINISSNHITTFKKHNLTQIKNSFEISHSQMIFTKHFKCFDKFIKYTFSLVFIYTLKRESLFRLNIVFL